MVSFSAPVGNSTTKTKYNGTILHIEGWQTDGTKGEQRWAEDGVNFRFRQQLNLMAFPFIGC